MAATPLAPPDSGPNASLGRALASLALPGLGQIALGHRGRGLAVMIGFITVLVTAVWYRQAAWFAVPALMWAWSVWDAVSLARTARKDPPTGAPAWLAAALWCALAYGIGLQVTEVNIDALIGNTNRAAILLEPMTRPDFFAAQPGGGIGLSENGQYIIRGITETLALALLATTLGALLALPISFLAARNLMSANAFTRGVYFAVRGVLNLTRSIESLLMAIIFVVIVGLGPFPGMLAITVHTAAALGKLFSEVIEGIDPGQIEAVRATGANWLQTIRYAVIPQVLPPFASLTIYRWDINVRSSTIIGFVGGGGIGFYLYQWILNQDFRAVSASFIAIALVVIAMDYFSAKVRARLI